MGRTTPSAQFRYARPAHGAAAAFAGLSVSAANHVARPTGKALLEAAAAKKFKKF
jgi:hypothetical protein